MQGQRARTSKVAIGSAVFGVLGLLIMPFTTVVHYPYSITILFRNITGLLGICGLTLGVLALLKISRLVLASVSFVLFSVFLPYLLTRLSKVWWPYDFFMDIRGLLVIYALACSLVFTVVTLVRTGKPRSMLKGGVSVFAGISLANIGIVLAGSTFGFWLVETCHPRSICVWSPGHSNLQCLVKAMLIYAYDNNGQYPEPNQWCDVLLKHGQVDIEHFVCPSIGLRWPYKHGNWPFGLGNWPSRSDNWPYTCWTVLIWPFPRSHRSHFAMNPNCRPDSPPNMVLLFEAKEGWNQFGGPELLTTEHHRGYGCLVINNEGDVRFERPRGFQDLKWDGE